MTPRRRIVALAGLGLMLIAAAGGALAAPSPFGVGLPEATVSGGVFTWLAQRQAEFNRALYATLRLLRTDTTALWSLTGLGFVYGVLHAAGPGHGKAVISAYLVASGETIRRGIALAFVSAFAQAGAAIVVVGIATYALHLTAVAVTNVTLGLELTAGVAITVLGLAMLWRRLRPHRTADVCPPPSPQAAAPQRPALRYRGAVVRAGDTCAACGTIHPARITSWRQAAAAVLTVALRPCTGALIVLTFAFSLQLWWAGVLATLAMAFGTGLTVAALASLTVIARDVAERLGNSATWRPRLVAALGVAAALAITAMGLVILGAGLAGTALAG